MKVKYKSSQGYEAALKVFKAASESVPAYKDFLSRNRINPKNVKTPNDFSGLPVIDKQNYISQYSLKELSWNGDFSDVINFPMSSGSNGEPYFWPSGLKQDAASKRLFAELIDAILGKENESLLFVSSFALGTWKAGTEVYDAIKSLAEEDSRINLVTPSIDKHEALRQIKNLAKYFNKIILAGYPPFVKDIVQLALDSGLNLKSFNLFLVTAGEAFSEKWREGVLNLIGRPGETHRLINFYGMAETGIIGFETIGTITLRQNALQDSTLYDLIGGNRSTSLYCYDPSIRYIEISQGDRVIMTSDAGIPLIRYDTRDQGGLLEPGSLTPNLSEAKGYVYLFGRKDVSATLYGVNIYIENIKAALENKKMSKSLSGLFVMETKNKKNLDKYIYLKVETSRNTEPNSIIQKELASLVFETLRSANTEFNKLASSIGSKAKPRVKLVKYGELQAAPGKKHRWVKKN